MIRAGRLNEMITLLQRTTEVNVYGERTATYTKVSMQWANVQVTGADLGEYGNEVRTNYSVTFRVRDYVKVQEDWYVEYKSKRYRIMSIVPDPQQGTLIIQTSEVNE